MGSKYAKSRPIPFPYFLCLQIRIGTVPLHFNNMDMNFVALSLLQGVCIAENTSNMKIRYYWSIFSSEAESPSTESRNNPATVGYTGPELNILRSGESVSFMPGKYKVQVKLSSSYNIMVLNLKSMHCCSGKY